MIQSSTVGQSFRISQAVNYSEYFGGFTKVNINK
jgi:hypothetical protein